MARKPTYAKQARAAKAPGGVKIPWEVTGSVSDVIGAAVALGEIFNPAAALNYNTISFSALFSEREIAPGKDPILAKTHYPIRAIPESAEWGEGIKGAELIIQPFLVLRADGTNAEEADSSIAIFEVVFWVDGKDIIAGYTQLGGATGFETDLGSTASVQFGGTAFSKSLPSIFMITFVGYIDRKGFGNMEFTGSVAVRADGMVKALHCNPVARPLLSLPERARKLLHSDPVAMLYPDPVARRGEGRDGVMWTIGWKTDPEFMR